MIAQDPLALRMEPFPTTVDEEAYAQKVADEIVGEANRCGIALQVRTHNKRYSEMGLLVLPVVLPKEMEWPEDAETMGYLEDWWNDREPTPYRRVRVTSAGNPELSLRSTLEPVGTV